MKYRSRTDIIAMILQASMNGATKTRLMYGAYLSYAQIQEYLKYLTERRLISFEPATHAYALTEQGLRFLRIYDELSEITGIVPLKNAESPNVATPATLGQP
jgi:predicted transcriptional regulator